MLLQVQLIVRPASTLAPLVLECAWCVTARKDDVPQIRQPREEAKFRVGQNRPAPSCACTNAHDCDIPTPRTRRRGSLDGSPPCTRCSKGRRCGNEARLPNGAIRESLLSV